MISSLFRVDELPVCAESVGGIPFPGQSRETELKKKKDGAGEAATMQKKTER